MSGVDKDYENLLLSSWEKADEQVNHMICKERKANNANDVKTHSRENHEYHLKRWGHCIYCESGVCLVTD